MRVCIIGSGYVGLVTGACLAEIGHVVVCVDKDQNKIARLLAGDIPIYEPGLAELVTSNLAKGRLRFETGIDKALDAPVDFFFIAVGTPPRVEDGAADLRHVYAAAAEASVAVAKAFGDGDSFSVFVRLFLLVT